MWWLLWGTLAAQAQDCPNPEWAANQAEEYVLSFVLEDASASLERAEVAFGCSEPADPVVVARLLDAEGTIALLQGHPEEATAAYATARALAPDTWKADYGDEAKALWAAATPAGSGTVELLGLSGRVDVWVDGSPVKTPVRLSAGPHLVQVAHRGQTPAFAKWVRVRADETASLHVSLPEVPVVAGPTAVAAPVRKKSGLLWTGMAVATAGVATGATTWAMNRDPERVVSEGYEAGMKAANVAGWSLAGVGFGLGVVGVVGSREKVAVEPMGNGLRVRGRF